MRDRFLRRLAATRQSSWRLIQEKYPETKDRYARAGDLLQASVSDGSIILDAGCGHRSIPVVDRVHSKRIGVDLVQADIRQNISLDLGVRGSLSAIPLLDGSVDVVVSTFVVEHLPKPEVVFAEFRRVLRAGGHLVVMTPSKNSPYVMAARLVPNRLHAPLLQFLAGRRESDVFPTFYRANSARALTRALRASGFVDREVIMYQPPPFAFAFSVTLCRLMIAFYRFVAGHEWASPLRSVIIARFRAV